MLCPITTMPNFEMATAVRINAENDTILRRNTTSFVFSDSMVRMPSSFLPHPPIFASQFFATRSTKFILMLPDTIKSIIWEVCHIILHKENFNWYKVEGDNLWVLLECGKATGIEIWESPYCLGEYLDQDKPFYVRFSPKDESLYCDVGNMETLESAMQTAQAYYIGLRRPMSTTIKENRPRRQYLRS